MRHVILGLIAIITVFLYSCQKDNNAAPAGAFPIKLAITAIQPAAPLAGLPFSITVSALGSANTPANVTENTSFLISASGGTGQLRGTFTGTIQAGTSSLTITNLIYSAATPNLVLTVTRMLGNNLTSASSAGFPVQNASPTVASSYQITGIAPTSPVAGAPFSITVTSVNFGGSPTNVTTNANFQISASGPGALSGTVSGTIAAGTNNVVISGLTYSTANSALVLTATRVSGESLAPATSQNIVVQAASGGGGGSNPSRLLVAGISPASPYKDSVFSLAVTTLDANGIPVNVTVDTEVRLTANGPGVLTGNLTGIIPAGGFVVTFNGLRYSAATTSLVITATRVSGNAVSAGASSNITVLVNSCIPPAVQQNIIGVWNSVAMGTNGGTATFNADGTGSSQVNPEGPFTAEVTINNDPPVSLYDYRWTIANDTLYLEYFIPSNQPSLRRASGTFPITRNACNAIDVEFTGLGVVTLFR